jgi:hypothetical protein
VSDEAADLLIKTPSSDRSETKLCRSSRGWPGVGAEAAGRSDVAEAASDVGRIEDGAVRGREHDILIGPSGPCALASVGLAVLLLAERDDRTMR